MITCLPRDGNRSNDGVAVHGHAIKEGFSPTLPFLQGLAPPPPTASSSVALSMSANDRDLYFHDDFTFYAERDLSLLSGEMPNGAAIGTLQPWSPIMSFDDYLKLDAFDPGELASPELVADGAVNSTNNLTPSTGCGGGTSPASPSSSVPSSSTEAAGEEDTSRRKKDHLKQEEEEEIEKDKKLQSKAENDKSKKV
ncbi:hypothetical protein B296_00040630 [Ensete ventricosum]|uniref:Uncharacterized protein n=1 Tax=Ensete ventricosum TaxID=4639 RepID=A0A426ZPL6_ENSVE|nr:hypothetical protein B296_00040630 [Ensete ventricosum]